MEDICNILRKFAKILHTCFCGQSNSHKGEHVCGWPDCKKTWG